MLRSILLDMTLHHSGSTTVRKRLDQAISRSRQTPLVNDGSTSRRIFRSLEGSIPLETHSVSTTYVAHLSYANHQNFS